MYIILSAIVLSLKIPDNNSVSSTTILGNNTITYNDDAVDDNETEKNTDETVKDEVEEKELNEHKEKLKVFYNSLNRAYDK